MRPSRLPQFAICPWREDQQAPAEALARLQGLAINGVLLQRQATSTFTALTAMRHGAGPSPSNSPKAGWRPCTCRAGVRDRIDRNDRGRTLPVGSGAELQLLQISREIIKRSPRFRLCLPPDIENFAPLPLGSLLAEDEAARWVVDEPGAILFPMADVAEEGVPR